MSAIAPSGLRRSPGGSEPSSPTAAAPVAWPPVAPQRAVERSASAHLLRCLLLRPVLMLSLLPLPRYPAQSVLRTPVRPDGGDACEESDSDFICQSRAHLKAVRKLRLPIAYNTDSVDLLMRLREVLEKQPDTGPPSHKAQLVVMHTVAADLLETEDEICIVQVALAAWTDPLSADVNWPGVWNTSAPW